jgi:heme O synthase-like polyprenyltransferase
MIGRARSVADKHASAVDAEHRRAYLVASVGLGAVFIYGAWRLARAPSRRTALRLYLFSLAYLAALFAAMALDANL